MSAFDFHSSRQVTYHNSRNKLIKVHRLNGMELLSEFFFNMGKTSPKVIRVAFRAPDPRNSLNAKVSGALSLVKYIKSPFG